MADTDGPLHADMWSMVMRMLPRPCAVDISTRPMHPATLAIVLDAMTSMGYVPPVDDLERCTLALVRNVSSLDLPAVGNVLSAYARLGYAPATLGVFLTHAIDVAQPPHTTTTRGGDAAEVDWEGPQGGAYRAAQVSHVVYALAMLMRVARRQQTLDVWVQLPWVDLMALVNAHMYKFSASGLDRVLLLFAELARGLGGKHHPDDALDPWLLGFDYDAWAGALFSKQSLQHVGIRSLVSMSESLACIHGCFAMDDATDAYSSQQQDVWSWAPIPSCAQHQLHTVPFPRSFRQDAFAAALHFHAPKTPIDMFARALGALVHVPMLCNIDTLAYEVMRTKNVESCGLPVWIQLLDAWAMWKRVPPRALRWAKVGPRLLQLVQDARCTAEQAMLLTGGLARLIKQTDYQLLPKVLHTELPAAYVAVCGAVCGDACMHMVVFPKHRALHRAMTALASGSQAARDVYALACTLANVVALRYRPVYEDMHACATRVLEHAQLQQEEQQGDAVYGGTWHTAKAASLILWAAMYARHPLPVEMVEQLLSCIACAGLQDDAASNGVSRVGDDGSAAGNAAHMPGHNSSSYQPSLSVVIIKAVLAVACMFVDQPHTLEGLRGLLSTLVEGVCVREVGARWVERTSRKTMLMAYVTIIPPNTVE